MPGQSLPPIRPNAMGSPVRASSAPGSAHAACASTRMRVVACIILRFPFRFRGTATFPGIATELTVCVSKILTLKNGIDTVQTSVQSGRTRTQTTRTAVTIRSHPTRDPQWTEIDASSRSPFSLARTLSLSSLSLARAALRPRAQIGMLHPRASLLTPLPGCAPSIPLSPATSILPWVSQ